jgi:hypothetical protein
MLKPLPLKRISYLTGVFILLFTQSTLKAQQDLTLYNMASVPQRMYTNPSFRPSDSTIFIGLPMLSSEYFNFSNNGFKYSDLIQHDGDSLMANVGNMLSKLAKVNYITFSYHTDLLSFGFPVKKNYFSFNISENVDIRFGYTSDFMNFLWKGNGDPSTMGQPVNLAPSLNAMHYREYGLGWSRHITNKLTVGVKLKYLYGEEDVNTENTNASITTDPNDFALTAQANINVNTSGVINSFGNNFDVSDYLFKKKNNGAAIDLGGTYKYNDKLSFSASITDLGFITWRTETTNYESNDPNASFTYNGIDLNQFINNNSVQINNVIQNTLDSAKNIFKVNTLNHSYTTMLTAQTYLSANYKLLDRTSVGALFYAQIVNGYFNPAGSLSLSQQVGRWLTASINYSAYDRSYTNIGFGLAIGSSPVQFYIADDNILGMFMPQNAKVIMLHFGMNIILLHKTPVPKKAQL